MAYPLLVAFCLFAMLMLGGIWLGYRVYYRPGRLLRQLGAPVISDDTRHAVVDDQAEPVPSTIVSVLHQIGSRVPSSEAEQATLKTNLIQAGFRSENAAAVFYGVRILSTLMMLIVSLMLEAQMPPNPAMKVALMGFGCMTGWILPRMFLERKSKKRQETVRLSLPDALDLLVVSVEAGLGLDQAIQHVARELMVSHPQLSEELSLVTLEMRAGKRRSEALRNLERPHRGAGNPQAGGDPDSERPVRHQHGRIAAHAFGLSADAPPPGGRGTGR